MPTKSRKQHHEQSTKSLGARESAEGSAARGRRGQGVNLVVVLQALRRRWLLATALGLFLATTVAAGFWIFLPPAQPLVYTWIFYPEKVGGVWNEHPDPPVQRQTQAALIKNPILLNKVLGKPDVRELEVVQEQAKPDEWLSRELRVEFPSGPEILQLSMSGDRPEQLKQIVATVRKIYLEDYKDKSQQSRDMRLESLRAYDTRTKIDVEAARMNLRKNAEQGKDVDKITIAMKVKIAMELLEQTKKEYVKVQSDLRQMKIEETALLGSNPQQTPMSGAILDLEVNRHPLLQPYVRRIEELKDDLEKLKIAAPSNPKVVRVNADIVEAQKQLAAKKLELRPLVESDLKSKQLTNRDVMLTMLQSKIKEYEAFKLSLEHDTEELNKQTSNMNQQTVTVDEETQKIAMLESIRSRLLLTIEQLTAEKNPPDRAQSMGEVIIHNVDENARKLRFAMIGAVTAIGLTLLLIAFLEIRSRRLLSPDEVVEGLGMPVVGTVPAPPKRFGKVLTDENSNAVWQTMLTESVDSFRTQLLHTARKNSIQVVMVSSAASGEGKTSLACHLAVSLARSGLKTLLVDADLRNPSTHDLFQLNLEPGLCEVLRDAATTEQAVQRTQIPGLWLLPAGECTPRVIELLAQEPLAKVFNSLREEYDFIIVDSSPILPVTDPLLIAQHADGVVFSFMREVTRMGAAKAAVDRLRSLNVLTLGAVVNGTRPSTYGYSYGKYTYPVNN
jgi:succinoglycan biosynthesis transport protein ExoP